ncbi:MAG: site-specific integrase, partial [Sphingorhabdus sp.]
LAKVGVEGSNPFARSRHPEIAEKQSKNRTQRSKTAVCYAELLHNAQSSSSTSICNRSENSRNDCYTNLLRKLPAGAFSRGGIIYYRKRVPNALRTVLGRSEIWRSLRTDSVEIARRRFHAAAAEVEAEFDVARVAIGLLIQPMVATSRHLDGIADQRSLLNELHLRFTELGVESSSQKSATGKTLGEVYDLYTVDPRHTWCKRTVDAYLTTRKWVTAFFGEDTPIEKVTREQCRGFVQMLLDVPRHADRKFPHLTILQAVEEGKKAAGTVTISIANVNAYLNKLGGVLNWAVDEGYIDKSPAKGLRLTDPVKRRDKRRPFSTDQLRCIFNAPLFTGCVDDVYGYAKVGDARPRRARFWIPLIALFSGLRMNEICQLDTADVKLIDGVHCFVIIEGSVESDKRVKTAASERIVPIHNELIRIGFLRFVADQRKAMEEKLFDELSVGPHGYRSTNFSKWFSRFLHRIGAHAPLTCFHSFRHCFRDALRASRADRDISLALGGWTSGEDGSGIDGIYGDGFRAALLAEGVNRIEYPDLNLDHLVIE